MAAAPSKLVADLIDRLEIKIEAELATPEYLNGLQAQLDHISPPEGNDDPEYQQYAHELQALISGTRGEDEEALRCLDAALAEAGSPRRLHSRLLENYARKSSRRLFDSATLEETKQAAVKEPEEFKEPIAKTYKILYWYAAAHIVEEIGTVLWQLLVTHPWRRYTADYAAKHHLHASVQFLQLQDKVGILVFPAIFIGIYVGIVRTKRRAAIIGILKVFVFLDVLGALNDLAKPTTYRLIIDVVSIGFVLLVLWSLSKREQDILKLVGLKRGSEEAH
jgi:hypothetical protein